MQAQATVHEVRVMLYPRDFEVTRQFYQQVLGWPLCAGWDGPESRGAMFDMGSGILELLWEAKSGLPVQGCRLSLRVADVWQLWETLQTQASVVFPLRHNAWGDDSFCVADPDGFELIFFTERP